MNLILSGFFFFILNFALGGIISAINGQKLSNYLRKHNYKKWKSQRILGISGTNNPFKTFPYIYNSQDTGDKEILKLKRSIRYWIFHSAASIVLAVAWGLGWWAFVGGSS